MSSAEVQLTDFHPFDLARQLTLLESALYQKIQPEDCLQRVQQLQAQWKLEHADVSVKQNQDNLSSAIQASKRISDWVAESVLSSSRNDITMDDSDYDSSKGAETIEYFILVADVGVFLGISHYLSYNNN